MLLILAMAEAGGSDAGGTAAIIGAIAALITAVFAGIFKFLQTYDGRTDKAIGESMKSMAAQRDDALEGEKRAQESETRAWKERDEWMMRALIAEAELKATTKDPNADKG